MTDRDTPRAPYYDKTDAWDRRQGAKQAALAEIARLTAERAAVPPDREPGIWTDPPVCQHGTIVGAPCIRCVGQVALARAAVPPDREKLIASLAELGTELMDAEWDAVELINDTLAALRSPAPAECEEIARHLLTIAGSGVSLDYDRFILREAAALLRSHADGWREGAEAMREACVEFVEAWSDQYVTINTLPSAIRALPIPSPPAEEKTP